MKVGIVSDSHGSLGRIPAAIDIFVREKVEAVLHCGDIGSESVLIELSLAFEPSGIPVHAVLGNVDQGDRAVYMPFLQAPGISVHGHKADLKLADKRIAILHGHDYQELDMVILSGQFDYVLTGHTHMQEDVREGQTRVINPGAIYRSNDPSVAILNLASDDLRYVSLDR